MRANLISTKVSASDRKSTQVHASPGQTKSQVDPSVQLASPVGQGFRIQGDILSVRPLRIGKLLTEYDVNFKVKARLNSYIAYVSHS